MRFLLSSFLFTCIAIDSILCTLQFQLFDTSRCYIEELYFNSIAVIKYKISIPEGKPKDEARLTQLLNNVHFVITKDDKQTTLHSHSATKEKGKFSFHAETDGRYYICAYMTSGWHVSAPVFVSLKIGSNNMDEPKLDNILKKEHIDEMHDKARDILDKANRVIDIQKDELTKEDDIAQIQIKTSRNYYYIVIMQVLVFLGLGLYQVFSFRKYLASNYLI